MMENRPDSLVRPQLSFYRLVYEVIDREVVVLVIAIGKRDKDEVYRKAHRRE